MSCNKDVQIHCCFAEVKNENEHILAQAGIFYMSSKDVNAFRICPFHCPQSLALDGKGARTPAGFQMRLLPMAKEKLSKGTEASAE